MTRAKGAKDPKGRQSTGQATAEARDPAGWSAAAAPIAAILGLVAAAWFGLVSAGARLAYQPLGVQPREVGLDSAALLAQAAAPITAFVVGAAVLAIFWMIRFDDIRITPQRAPLIFGAICVSTWVLGACVVLVTSSATRKAFEDGKEPATTFGLWPAEIATLGWAGVPTASTSALPSCVLFLGSAGSTTVVYDYRHKQVIRIPSSGAILTVRRGKSKC